MKKYKIVLFGLLVLLCFPVPSFSQGEDLSQYLMPMPEEKMFHISGFMDMQVKKPMPLNRNSIIGQFMSQGTLFWLNNINMYMRFKISEGFLAFSEINYRFAPDHYRQKEYVKSVGSDSYDIEVNVPFDNHEHDNQNIETEYGSITIERAYMEWNTYSLCTLRAGRFLTPFGIWSQDHGAPVLTSVRVPAIVASPSSSHGMPLGMTGFELIGNVEEPLSGSTIDYAAYVGNNMAEDEQTWDDEDMKAFGGFFNITLPELADMVSIELGFSGYSGMRKIVKYDTHDTKGYRIIYYKFHQNEIMALAHAKITVSSLPLDGTLIIQAEGMQEWVDENKNERILSSMAGTTPKPDLFSLKEKGDHDYNNDHTYISAYGQIEYQFFGWITPYYRYEYIKNNTNENTTRWVYETVTMWTVGLNIKPTPKVVLKLEYYDLNFHPAEIEPAWLKNELPIFIVEENDMRTVQASVSMIF